MEHSAGRRFGKERALILRQTVARTGGIDPVNKPILGGSLSPDSRFDFYSLTSLSLPVFTS